MSVVSFLRRALAASVCVSAMVAHAADVPRVTLYRTGTFGVTSTYDYRANLASANVLGTAAPELISCFDGAAYVLAHKGGAYAPVWHSAPVGCSAVAVGDRDGDGAPEIYAGTTGNTGANGSIVVFDPRNYGPPRGRIDIGTNVLVKGVATGDVDGDGQLEIVAITASDAYVYDANSLALQWKAAGKGGTQVKIGNVDGDARLEIVVNGPTAYVLDAQAQQEKWGYVGGFGRVMDLGNTDGDPILEIVYMSSYPTRVDVLHGDTFASSSFNTEWLDYMVVGDANGDGQHELVGGNNQWGPVRGYRFSDGALLYTISNPGWGTTAMAVGDFDGDATNEICWVSGFLYVGNAVTKTIEWSQTTALYGRLLSRVADLDGDGNLEQIIGGQSGYYGALQVFDLKTRTLKGTLKPPGNASTPVAMVIETGQLDADPALEIAVANGEGVWVWDGATHGFQWNSPYSYSGVNLVAPITIANVDSDAVNEIVIATTDRKVQILNGATPVIQWATPVLADLAKSLAVADIDNDGANDLIIGTWSGYYVFRLSDGAQRKHVTLNKSVLAVAATTAGGGQFAIVHGSNTWGDGPMSLRTFSGTSLSEQWNCSLAASTDTLGAIYSIVGTETRLLVGQNGTGVRNYPMSSASCPAYDLLAHPGTSLALQSIDTTGDGRPELALTSFGQFELNVIGAASEARGDVNLDGVVSDADIDALAAYLLAGAPGAPPGADVNADGAIATDDLFYLINYRRGTGNAPPPQQ